MVDLDAETGHDEPKYYPTGPGRRRIGPGPVIDAYADGAIDRDCDNCGAKPLQFCRHRNGALRKLPCPQRLSEPNR